MITKMLYNIITMVLGRYNYKIHLFINKQTEPGGLTLVVCTLLCGSNLLSVDVMPLGAM